MHVVSPVFWQQRSDPCGEHLTRRRLRQEVGVSPLRADFIDDGRGRFCVLGGGFNRPGLDHRRWAKIFREQALLVAQALHHHAVTRDSGRLLRGVAQLRIR